MSEGAPRARPSPGDKTYTQTFVGLGRLIDSITPWLLDLGSWTFGALIAFNLVVLGALLTVGPVDLAVKIATAAFAVALPLGVGGLVLLRLLTDMGKSNLGDTATKAMIDVGFSFGQARPTDESRARRIALLYTYALLTVTVLMTLTGLTASLWHMGWWIGVVFIVVAFLSQLVVVLALSPMSPQGRWRAPGGEVEPEKKAPG